jgi:hypothetical protein
VVHPILVGKENQSSLERNGVYFSAVLEDLYHSYTEFHSLHRDELMLQKLDLKEIPGMAMDDTKTVRNHGKELLVVMSSMLVLSAEEAVSVVHKQYAHVSLLRGQHWSKTFGVAASLVVWNSIVWSVMASTEMGLLRFCTAIPEEESVVVTS